MNRTNAILAGVSFSEANRLPDAEFAAWARVQREAWRDRMLAEGMVYFPSIDRWYPEGTEIRGVEPGEFVL